MQAFSRFAVRDLLIVSSTIVLWLLFGSVSAGDGLAADFVGAALGLAGGVCAWLAHEWGHLLSGRAVGATMRAPTTLKQIYLFGFDNKRNSQAQFIVMALGGFVGTALAFSFAWYGLPPDWMATRVMRGLILLEASVTVLLEVPGLLLGILAYDRLPSVDVLND
ncbi:MAG: hypothetical protein AAGJ50_11755 [Pseudomonadota bacterium]